MVKVFLGNIINGRLKRLQYFGYSLLLGVLVVGFGLIIGLAIGAGEHIVGGNLQQAQALLREWLTLPFLIVFGLASVLCLFGGINIMAKRIRDIGLPGWWTTLIILVLEVSASFAFSEQHSGGLHSIIWIALLLVPTDTLVRRMQQINSRK